MSLNESDRFADFLAGLYRDQDRTQQNINPNDPVAQDLRLFTANIVLRNTLRATQKTLKEGVLVIDHLVYGWIDDNTLYADGVYDTDDVDYDKVLQTRTF